MIESIKKNYLYQLCSALFLSASTGVYFALALIWFVIKKNSLIGSVWSLVFVFSIVVVVIVCKGLLKDFNSMVELSKEHLGDGK